MTLTPKLAELLRDSVIEGRRGYADLGCEMRERLEKLEDGDVSVVNLFISLFDHLEYPLPDSDMGVMLTCLLAQEAVVAAILEMADAPVS